MMRFTPGRRETELSSARWQGTWPEKKQNALVDVEDLETFVSNSTDAEGFFGVLTWSACDREGRRRFVARKTEATLVAKVKQYAMMRAMQDEEYQELHEVIENVNEKKPNPLSTM